MSGLDGKKALVTGANGGIGQAIVNALQAKGAIVAGSDISKCQADISIDGNLTDTDFCDRLPGLARERMDGLDVLVNNAGIITRGTSEQTSDEDFRRTMAINVEAPFRICRAAIPILAEAGGGAIVNTSSCWGVHPGPNHPLYVMSKAAVASLTQCLGMDHAHQGIRV
ncbi:MAG: SDR family oxidoreductase, partial [Pseudomonadota bacterium]